MVDIPQQVAHWRDGVLEDWQVAAELLQNGRARQALSFPAPNISGPPKYARTAWYSIVMFIPNSVMAGISTTTPPIPDIAPMKPATMEMRNSR